MRGVFADSSFWIALRDKREQNHAIAKSLASEMLEAKTTFVITVMIFAETHAYFSRELVLRERIIRDFWENPVIQIVPISHQDQSEAIAILRQHKDKRYSLCDAISFAIIRRLQLIQALSFDSHFDQFGEFNVLN
jgi:predicted nucleic acid-binding protein